MYKIYFLLLMILLCFNSCKLDDTDDNIDEGDLDLELVAYWNFDSENGEDVSENKYHGELNNEYKFVEGVSGKAVHFTGQGENSSQGGHMLIPSIDFTSLEDFSINMWVKEESYSYFGGSSFIFFGGWIHGNLAIKNEIIHQINQGKTRYYQYTVGSYYNDENPRDVKYIDEVKKIDNGSLMNKWVMHTLVYKDGIVSGYQDGVLIDSKTQKIQIGQSFAALARDWWVYHGDTFTHTRFTGAMDEVKIFSKALSDDDISDLFKEQLK